MKKNYLLLISCCVLAFGCDQSTTETTTTDQTDTSVQAPMVAEPEPEPVILLGSQPADTTRCYKLEDFKQKLTVEKQPNADSSIRHLSKIEFVYKQ